MSLYKKLKFRTVVFLMAEDGGFEPPVPCGTHRFQRCALDHSANLPKINEQWIVKSE